MKLFHAGESTLSHPVYGYVHDAYHVEPNQCGEGQPGSGLLYRFTEKQSTLRRTVVHAIALDEAAYVGTWALHSDENSHTLTNGQRCWTLTLHEGRAEHLSLVSGHGRRWDVIKENDTYTLQRIASHDPS